MRGKKHDILPLNIFFEEPDPDRWFKFDRFPRRLIRRIVRGRQRPGGVMMVALGLMKGLDRLGVRYRFNDYKYIKKHPDEIACIVGKPQLLDKFKWKNPIIFGAGIFSHPVDCPDLLERYPTIRKILVPGPWMKHVFDPYYGGNYVEFWPVGIDTDQWSPTLKSSDPTFDFLIYDKIRWEHERYDEEIISPIKKILSANGLSFQIIRYGYYTPDELIKKLADSRFAIFLCEHETQGQAYQQILSTNTPILAWDRSGFWVDPAYYPHRVKYRPVSSVPYWDERCGEKFTNAADFEACLKAYLSKRYEPRAFIEDQLSLEKATNAYLKIYEQVKQSL